ncbi:MAG: type II toxin-antitoxin system prevent-host-death family antitoxin [Gammaproteobacteria bacterium]|nr:type II toxin-antitoxin system prevent-host-death family antitoxin [Gammaproteobacteria bacterium]
MARQTAEIEVGTDWPLTEAKNRLSEVVTKALTEGPQRIARREEAVVVVAEETFNRLVGRGDGFIAYLMNGPSFEGMTVQRDPRPMRDAKL